MKNRLVAIVLTLLFVISFSFSAYAEPDIEIAPGSNKSGTGEADADIYVDFWGVWANDNVVGIFLQEKGDEYAKIFGEEHNCTVKFEYVFQDGYDGVAQKVAAGAVSGATPVLAQLEESFLPQFVPVATDMSTVMDPEVLGNYLDGLMISCTQNDTIYAVPSGRSYPVYYVNEDLLKQAGHTIEDLGTWESFHECCKDISALGDDIYGLGIFWDSDSWMWESALYSNGGQVVSDDGSEVTFGEKGAIFYELIKEMLADGSAYNPYGNSEPVADLYERFLGGRLGIFGKSCATYSYLKNEMATDNPDYADFTLYVVDQPAGEAGKSVTTGGSNVIICNRATDAQKAFAAGYLTYLASDENMAKWSLEVTSYLPNTKTCVDSEYYNTDDPNVARIRDGVQYAHARPQTPYWREMYNYMREYQYDFSTHPENYDPQKLNDELAAYCQGIIDENE